MRTKFFIIPAALIFQVAGAQNSPVPLTASKGNFATVSPASTTTYTVTDPVLSSLPSGTGESIMDYKSVYDAGTIEEEVQMASERFQLTKSQQDVWMTAAVERRQTEKLVYGKINSKGVDYDREGVYKALRMAHNTFYETITGYLNPDQKQAMEVDRAIMSEKRKRLALLPPPAPTVTVAPVDSATIKEPEKTKGAVKKTRKKKKPAGS